MKNKIYNIILAILGIALLITIILIIAKYAMNQENEKELKVVVEDVKSQIEQLNNQTENVEELEQQVEVEYKGYNVVGILTIPTIELEYPIINETSDKSMQVSITKFWGNEVNDIGNFTMAGHNYLDGTMFGKTKYLNIGDKINMTDLTGRTIEYEIFKIYVIDANDVSCVNSVEENKREITLITCTKGKSNRLIIKAREVVV